MSQTYIALLRGINVGGNKLVPMADLRAHLTSLGFEGVQTLLQSGNVVLRAAAKPCGELESTLEAAALDRFGHDVSFVVRTAGEWDAVIEANPYSSEAKDDPSHLLVVFMKEPPKPELVATAEAALNGPERFKVIGREIFTVFPEGIGNSKLLTLPAWKKLAGHGTGRNWNTVLKLAALAKG